MNRQLLAMYLQDNLATLILYILLAAECIQAHSTKRDTIQNVTCIENVEIMTPSHRVRSHSSFDITFNLHNQDQTIRLSLSPNNDIASLSTVTKLTSDGSLQAQRVVERAELLVFKGRTFIKSPSRSSWRDAGWARISIKIDGERPLFEGAFSIDGDHHHIQTRSSYQRTRARDDSNTGLVTDADMVVWRDSDTFRSQAYGEDKRDDIDSVNCASDDLQYNNDVIHPLFRGMHSRDTTIADDLSIKDLIRRQRGGDAGGQIDLLDNIGSTNGCPTSSRVALLGIATDCTYSAGFDSEEDIRFNIISQINTASELYESTFNISLGLRNLTISDATCPSTAPDSIPWNVPCSATVDLSDRLGLFSSWRGQMRDGNALWTLLTTCNTGSTVGISWIGQLCVQGSRSGSGGGQSVSSANVVVRTSSEWQVIAHEIGHTFGAVHDCTSGSCGDGTGSAQSCCPFSRNSCDAGGRFMMNPSSGAGITVFSPCSIGNICTAMRMDIVRTDCLTDNRNITTITGGECGNGIVEEGEECDCGGEDNCGDNPCCNHTTCQFVNDAVCDPSTETCCTSRCQFASGSQVCRNSTGACDPEETCTGSSATCPSDTVTPDGQSCDAGGDYSDLDTFCASGQCTSRDLQCRTVIGPDVNNTRACNEDTCQVACFSSRYGSGGSCVTMEQNFVDGTLCGDGSRCDNGVCRRSTSGTGSGGGGGGNSDGSWLDRNRNTVIIVASVVGGLVVIAALWCIIAMCRRRSRARIPAQPPSAVLHMQMSNMPGPQGGQQIRNMPPSQISPWQHRGFYPPQGNLWLPGRYSSARYA